MTTGMPEPDFSGELYTTETVAELLGQSNLDGARRELHRHGIARVTGYPADEVRRMLRHRKETRRSHAS